MAFPIRKTLTSISCYFVLYNYRCRSCPCLMTPFVCMLCKNFIITTYVIYDRGRSSKLDAARLFIRFVRRVVPVRSSCQTNCIPIGVCQGCSSSTSVNSVDAPYMHFPNFRFSEQDVRSQSDLNPPPLASVRRRLPPLSGRSPAWHTA